MADELTRLEQDAISDLARATDAAGADAWKSRYLGRSGLVTAALARLKDLPRDERPAFGQRANALKLRLEAMLDDHRRSVAAGPGAAGPRVDVTEPGLITSSSVGRRHLLSRVREELVGVFGRLGFEVADGPELEDDEHNFVKLNIPAGHPARDPTDNFYVDDPDSTARPRMLRSQTSTVQVRVMERAVADGSGPPIRVVSPGRVYRPDTVDATHSFMFHQIEGLAIDRGLSMADLKATLLQFARAYFGDAMVRLRPSYFPFTEPSAEFDLRIALRPGDAPRWIELGGCGMVDPAVLTACGIDPEEWSGFAFGFGIERLAMGKYGVPDIRLLYGGDVRFLARV